VGRLNFQYTDLSEDERALRQEVREFLRQESYVPGDLMEFDAEFSKKMAAKGWLGMALPERFGGHARTAVDRFIVVEEMLRSGAPLGAHWVADRQTGPILLAFGTDEQKERFLPMISAGECYFSIGMSEPDAGSDLAGVRTTATRGLDGWLLNGTKIWTSGAHLNHYFVVLCRTGAPEADRHDGLSQLIVDLHSPGVQINPIPFLDGTHHFNEVVMTDVFVPDEMVLGEIGRGWQQVTSELAFERAGPDRYLMTWQVLRWFVGKLAREGAPEPSAAVVGRLTARFWALRQLSLAVSRAIDAGGAPAIEAAVVKDLGTVLEQDVYDMILSVLRHEPSLEDPELGERLLAHAILKGPSHTIAGGSTEILRTIAAKGLRR
jgi:alkylation response protein AidB-like acyl-CoA dehydrogenase